MNPIKANIYGKATRKPQNYLTLEEVHGSTRLIIVDEDGDMTYCGNLMSLASDGLFLCLGEHLAAVK